MIASALDLLVNEVNQYISNIDPMADEKEVALGHISLVESMSTAEEGTAKNMILSLVNLEEEKRLKNNGRVVKIDDEFGARTQLSNPPITLNLYLLFSSSYPDYFTSLRRLSQVIEFFQGKFVFTLSNSRGSASDEAKDLARLVDIKMVLDIHTLNFEQINDLWGSLGGKLVPFVMYRTRLMVLQREAPLQEGPVITEVTEDGSPDTQ